MLGQGGGGGEGGCTANDGGSVPVRALASDLGKEDAVRARACALAKPAIGAGWPSSRPAFVGGGGGRGGAVGPAAKLLLLLPVWLLMLRWVRLRTRLASRFLNQYARTSWDSKAYFQKKYHRRCIRVSRLKVREKLSLSKSRLDIKRLQERYDLLINSK